MVRPAFMLLICFVAGCRPGCAGRESAHEDASVGLADARPSTPIEEDSITVVITTTNILVEEEIVVPLTSSAIDAKYKRSGAADPYIVPLANKLRQLRDGGKATSKAIVVAHHTTPYHLLREVLFTLGQNDYGKFQFVLVTPPGERAVDASPSAPPSAPPSARTSGTTKELPLTVTITAEGVRFETSAGPLGAGCERGKPGITVPKIGPTHDLDGVKRCAKTLKLQAAHESHAVLSAQPSTDYGTVIAVFDVLRGTREEELFPDIELKGP